MPLNNDTSQCDTYIESPNCDTWLCSTLSCGYTKLLYLESKVNEHTQVEALRVADCQRNSFVLHVRNSQGPICISHTNSL